MRGNLQVIVITVVIFVGGLAVGVWTQQTRPMPPPPIGPMGEFGGPSGGPPRFEEPFGPPPPNGGGLSREDIRGRTDLLMRQLAAFRAKMDAIERQFRDAFEAILNPDQRGKLDRTTKRLRDLPDPLPGCGSVMGPVFVSMVIYRPTLEMLTQDLDLDQAQQKQLTGLLIERRNQMLTLVDDTPPPSFRLGREMRPFAH